LDGLSKQLSGARPVSWQTALLITHLEHGRFGMPKGQLEIPPPVDWLLWEKVMRATIAGLEPENVERFREHNRHHLKAMAQVHPHRTWLLERFLFQRMRKLANHGRSPH
jgi:hypothetical protein